MMLLPITLSNVSVSLSDRQVLNKISLTLSPGEHIGLIGPNGAGKSTLLRAIAGVLPLKSGVLEFTGEMPDVLTRARHMAYLPQQRTLAWKLSVEDVAALGRHAWGGGSYEALGADDRKIVDEALEKTGAAEFRGRAANALSGGEQARVHLARILATNADVLLLDEPCAGLDIRHQLSLMAVLEAERARGKTIVTVLHDLDLAERFCKRLIVLQYGKIVADGDSEVALNEKVLSNVFGLRREHEGHFMEIV